MGTRFVCLLPLLLMLTSLCRSEDADQCPDLMEYMRKGQSSCFPATTHHRTEREREEAYSRESELLSG